MIPAILLAAALLLLILALRLRRTTGVPWARVRMQDNGWRATDQPLVSRRFGLVGKPDYVIESRGSLIPIEVKPGRAASEPYESDLIQLAAYCLLIEDSTGRAPPYGLLRYATHSFRLDYTPAIRDALLDLLDDLRADRDSDDVPRSHDQPARCRACGFWSQCDDRLA
jgi:CRISPR-associated exonuclease Cas4